MQARNEKLNLNRVLLIAVCYLLVGLFMAGLWELITPPLFLRGVPGWSKLPLDVAIFCLGWLGYLSIGFSVGWLFNVVSALRTCRPRRSCRSIEPPL